MYKRSCTYIGTGKGKEESWVFVDDSKCLFRDLDRRETLESMLNLSKYCVAFIKPSSYGL